MRNLLFVLFSISSFSLAAGKIGSDLSDINVETIAQRLKNTRKKLHAEESDELCGLYYKKFSPLNKMLQHLQKRNDKKFYSFYTIEENKEIKNYIASFNDARDAVKSFRKAQQQPDFSHKRKSPDSTSTNTTTNNNIVVQNFYFGNDSSPVHKKRLVSEVPPEAIPEKKTPKNPAAKRILVAGSNAILYVHIIGGLNAKGISAILNLKESTVTKTLQPGMRQAFRKRMEQENGLTLIHEQFQKFISKVTPSWSFKRKNLRSLILDETPTTDPVIKLLRYLYHSPQTPTPKRNPSRMDLGNLLNPDEGYETTTTTQSRMSVESLLNTPTTTQSRMSVESLLNTPTTTQSRMSVRSLLN